MTTTEQDRGTVLVLVLLAITFMAAAGIGLGSSTMIARLGAANYDEATALANAAEGALELAARELGQHDVGAVLNGTAVSMLVDGPPGSRDVAPGVSIDLLTLTNLMTCGRPALCSDAQRRQVTSDRPWGDNNPRWRLFLHQALVPPSLPSAASAPYVAVWIGDDAREDDGDPAADGAGPQQEGRYIVRARAEAFGPRGGRRAIEAELIRRCTADPAGEVCLPGSRVHSWSAINQVP